MTYTRHRDTRDVLQILEFVDLHTDKKTEEDIFRRKFPWVSTNKLTTWQRFQIRTWALFEEPYSSSPSKVRGGEVEVGS
jgi:hypothetical protein